MAVLLYFVGRRRVVRSPWNARFATPADIPHLLENRGGLPAGVISGKIGFWQAARGLVSPSIPDRRAVSDFVEAFRGRPPPREVFLNDAVHTLICAQTNSGKSASLAIRYLLECPHSVVALDVKGELCRASYAARRALGPVAVIDPFGLIPERRTDSCNVLDIDPESSYALDDCRELAEALVRKTEGSKDPFWELSATQLLSAFIGLCVADGDRQHRSLQAVVRLLSDGGLFASAVQLMQASHAFGGMLARYGHQIASIHPKQLSSIKAVVHENLSFLSSPAIARVTGHEATVDPKLLRRGVLSVFIVLPPERIAAQSGFLRMLVTALARAAIREGVGDCGKVTFLLDEAASVGSLPVLSSILQIGRAYQVYLQLYFQSLGQLAAAWPNGGEQVVLSNTTHVYAGTNDFAEAEAISKRIGHYGMLQESGGTSHSRSSQGSQGGSVSTSVSDNWSVAAEPVIRPESILTLPRYTALVFAPNTRPILTRLRPYWSRNTGETSRARCVGRSVVLFLCAGVVAALCTLTVKEANQWKTKSPSRSRPALSPPASPKPTRTRGSSPSSGKVSSGGSPGASTTGR